MCSFFYVDHYCSLVTFFSTRVSSALILPRIVAPLEVLVAQMISFKTCIPHICSVIYIVQVGVHRVTGVFLDYSDPIDSGSALIVKKALHMPKKSPVGVVVTPQVKPGQLWLPGQLRARGGLWESWVLIQD